MVFVDEYSGRYFMSTHEKIKAACDDINRKLADVEEPEEWSTKEEYDALTKAFSMSVMEQIEVIIDRRIERKQLAAFTEFFKELGFDDKIAEAKARDCISIASR